MNKEFDLNGKQRNYRAAGKKLLPRNAYDAMRVRHIKGGVRQLRREDAVERAALGNEPWSRTERKVRRAGMGLSARAARLVERTAEYCIAKGRDFKVVGRARARYAKAIEQAHTAACLADIDQRMLRNAI